MPSLDDLKKNAVDALAAANAEPVVSVGQPTKDEGFVPYVEEGEEIPKPVNMSMMTGRPVLKAGSGDRVKADLSSLPKPKPTGKVALDPRHEVLDDVFGEGGQFDKYREMKKKEMEEYMAQVQMEEDNTRAEQLGQVTANEKVSEDTKTMEEEVPMTTIC